MKVIVGPLFVDHQVDREILFANKKLISDESYQMVIR